MSKVNEFQSIQQKQVALLGEAAAALKQLQTHTQYPVKNLSVHNGVLKLEIAIDNKWVKLTLPTDVNEKLNGFTINKGTISFNTDFSEAKITTDKIKPIDNLIQSDVLKLFNLLKGNASKKNSLLTAQLSDKTPNSLFIKQLQAELPMTEAITKTISGDKNYPFTIINTKTGIVAQGISNVSNKPIFEIKLSPVKFAEMLSQQNHSLQVKTTDKNFVALSNNQSTINLEKQLNHPITQWHPIKLQAKTLGLVMLPLQIPTNIKLDQSVIGKQTGIPFTVENQTSAESLQTMSVTKPKNNIETNPALDKATLLNAKLDNKSLDHKNIESRNVNSQAPDNKENTTSNLNKPPIIQAPIKPTVLNSPNSSTLITATNNISNPKPDLTDNQTNHPVNLSNVEKNKKSLITSSLSVANSIKNLVTNTLASEVKLNKIEQNPTEKPVFKPAETINSTAFIEKINQRLLLQHKQSPDLNALVNSAFSKMITSDNVSANKVRIETLNTIQPALVSLVEKQETFKDALQLVLLDLLTTKLSSSPTISTNKEHSLDKIIQTLFPEFKNNLTNIKQQLAEPNEQNLISDLGKIQQFMQQTQNNLVTQTQTDNSTSALLQLFLPLKFSEHVHSTEINLGRYKKTQEDGNKKDVWFIRLNFDFASKGLVQAQAQLIDANVTCSFLCSTPELIRKAEPHIATLKQHLTSHGLTVESVSFKQGTQTTPDFVKQHSIINIKV